MAPKDGRFTVNTPRFSRVGVQLGSRSLLVGTSGLSRRGGCIRSIFLSKGGVLGPFVGCFSLVNTGRVHFIVGSHPNIC